MQLTKEQWIKLLTGLSDIALAIKDQNQNIKSNATADDACDIFQSIITELDSSTSEG